MFSWAEFRLAFCGLLLLNRVEAQFVRHFDRSVAGALRSFWLALFILPYEILSTYLVALPHNVPSMGFFLAADVIGYLLGWTLFPLLLLSLERTLDREREMPGCIAVLNWSSLIGIALQLPSLLILFLGFGEDFATGIAYTGVLF